MAFIYDIKDRLVTVGVGTYDTDIFVGSKAVIPKGDGPYISLLPTGGSSAAMTQNETGTERPTAQIVGRGKSYSQTLQKLTLAYQALGAQNGLHNVNLSGTQYLSIVPRQTITDLGPDDDPGRVKMGFNIECEKGPDFYVPPPPPGPVPAAYLPVGFFGGTPFGFVNPSVADAYPSGATYDKVVPGSAMLLLNGDDIYFGTYYLEASAHVDTGGGRVKLAMFNLTSDPDTPMAGSEITFTSGELIGERKRSSGGISIPSGAAQYGVKMTTDNVLVAGAVWGAQLLRV